MHLSLLMLFAAGWVSSLAQPRKASKNCPEAYTFVEKVYIEFEKELVPKLEVLLKQNINKRIVAENNYFPNITTRCRRPRTDAGSLAGSKIVLGRINYISNLIANSTHFQRASVLYPLKPLTRAMEDNMRAGARQAAQVEAIKLSDVQFPTLTLPPDSANADSSSSDDF